MIFIRSLGLVILDFDDFLATSKVGVGREDSTPAVINVAIHNITHLEVGNVNLIAPIHPEQIGTILSQSDTSVNCGGRGMR